MTITPGTKLGPYEIIDPIGAGGMGEVYRARDTKLGREVAIKVLPEAFAQDRERLARFEREARLLASLNHPNIATIHGLEESDGVHYLVLELVPGKTLAERILHGPIPIDEALPIFKQIAEALEAAHEKGVIHRDLKPANVKVTPEGIAKVLDFGLAKAFGDELPASDLSQSPTVTREGTRAGVILGTAAYMSPEQARGKPVDRRTDNWAFGCVLYEGLTGSPTFTGETVTDVLAAIVHRDPDWDALPVKTSWRVREIIKKCLRKNARDRLQHIGDARVEIEMDLEEPEPFVQREQASTWPRVRRLSPWLLVALFAAVAFVSLWGGRSELTRSRSSAHFTVVLPDNLSLSSLDQPAIAASPDGNRLVVVAANERGANQLYLREIGSLETRPIAGTEGASYPFFSPDGEWLGFLRGDGIQKVLLEGGAPSNIYDGLPPASVARGARWAADDRILAVPDRLGSILQGTASGGELDSLTAVDSDAGELAHRWPDLIADGKALLFTVIRGDGIEDFEIAAQSLETGERRTLLTDGTGARYVPTGHLIYSRGSSLMAATFDPERLEITSPAVAILYGVLTDLSTGAAQFDFSSDGTLFYVPGQWKEPQRRLVWVDRKGRVESMTADRRAYHHPNLSPDGRRLLVDVDGANKDVWLYEISRGNLTRLTTHGADDNYPVWSPDGSRVAFTSNRLRFPSMYWKSLNSTEPAELIVPRRLEHYGYPIYTVTGENAQFPASWSPDGKHLLYIEDTLGSTQRDIWVWSTDEEARPFVRSPFEERQPAFSPHGQWVAYISDESGRFEVYVRSFPSGERAVQVSVGGGTEPVWAQGGDELFYRNEDKMMMVPISTTPSFEPGVPVLLFEMAFEYGTSFARPGYDVTPDAQRFVLVLSEEDEAPARRIHVVLNWFAELERLVPTEHD